MQLKDQVNSLEQGKRLKELGITEQATRYHRLCIVNGVESYEVLPAMIYHYGKWQENEDVFRCLRNEVNNDYAPAFTVAELGECLSEIDNGNIDATIFYNWHHGFWDSIITHINSESGVREVLDILNTECDTEAQARAEALIWLIENNHITASECNERLKSA